MPCVCGHDEEDHEDGGLSGQLGGCEIIGCDCDYYEEEEE